MSRIVSLRNPQGELLYCILEEPPGGAAGYAAVLLAPGIKTRVGPHRLYRKLAQEFLSRGIPVLRVDFHGLGDSEGELPEHRLDEIYRQVQLGRHVDDVRTALNWLESDYGIRRCLVGGLCGGALTGLLAAKEDARVAGLYAIGLPVALDGFAAAEHMTRGELQYERLRYLHKLMRPSSWLRLLSLQSDYSLMWRMLTYAFGKRSGRSMRRSQLDEVPPPASPLAANLNPLFPPAFFNLLRTGRPALLIFSEADRLRWEYQEKFAQPWAQSLEQYKGLLTTTVIANANHVLGDPASVTEARRLTGAWLDEQFSGARTPMPGQRSRGADVRPAFCDVSAATLSGAAPSRSRWFLKKKPEGAKRSSIRDPLCPRRGLLERIGGK